MAKLFKEHRSFILFMLIVTLLLFYKPVQVVPLWFDEGWVLSLARNWVEYGHYGERSAGEFVPSTILNTGFPATSLYALMFKLFGVGALQARILGNIILLACLWLLYALACKLYDRTTGFVALLIVLLTGAHPGIILLLAGRPAMGEMPMLAYVLAGFLCLTVLREKRFAWMLVPALLFSLAMNTKPQVAPFLFAGLFAGVFLAVLNKDKRAVRKYGWLFASTLITTLGMNVLWSRYIHSLGTASGMSTDPYAMVRDFSTLLTYVIALQWDVRLTILRSLTENVALLGLIGIGAEPLHNLGKTRLNPQVFKAKLQQADPVIAVFWVICTSWYVWWLFISIAWARYIYPAYFLASIFAARWLIRWIVSLKRRFSNGKFFRVLTSNALVIVQISCLIFVVVLAFIRTLTTTVYWYIHPNNHVIETTDYINAHADADTLVETYECELFFLLEPDYHYPPDEIQHIGNQRKYRGKDVTFEYDVDAWQPQYIVTGHSNRTWHVYDAIVAGEDYELVYQNDSYEVYQRVE